MAGVLFNVHSGEVVLVAATAKTVLQVKAPANQRVLIRSIAITGKQAAGGTDAPTKVRITRSTANFGTGTVQTPQKQNPADDETIQSTAANNFTVEPTAPTDQLWYREVQPQGGLVEYFPDNRPFHVTGGASINIELTNAATPTMLVHLTCEE